MRTRRGHGGTWAAIPALALVLLGLVAPAPSLAARARIDRAFGTNGTVATELGPSYEFERTGVLTPTADGGVVAAREDFAGDSHPRFYGADGTLEKTGLEEAVPRPEATLPGGGRLVVAQRRASEHSQARVVRLNADGSRDASFGEGGASPVLPMEVEGLVALPSGRVLVAGRGLLTAVGTKNLPIFQVLIARLDADGKLDQSFGKAGVVELDSEFEVAGDEVLSLQAHDGEGALVVGAERAAALDPGGRLERSFGKAGVVDFDGEIVAAEATGSGFRIAGSEAPDGSRGKGRRANATSSSPVTGKRGSSTRASMAARGSRPSTSAATRSPAACSGKTVAGS